METIGEKFNVLEVFKNESHQSRFLSLLSLEEKNGKR